MLRGCVPVELGGAGAANGRGGADAGALLSATTVSAM
jgi:hypothetical protein